MPADGWVVNSMIGKSFHVSQPCPESVSSRGFGPPIVTHTSGVTWCLPECGPSRRLSISVGSEDALMLKANDSWRDARHRI
jgi:hypothetical protein